MLSELCFESYLSYCPRKHWPTNPSRGLVSAEEWMKAIKIGSRADPRSKNPYEVVAERMREDAAVSDIGALFRTLIPPVLVPVPGSSLSPRREPYFWPGRELAKALVAHGFGQSVLVLLQRSVAQVKASMGGPRNAFVHRDSLAVMEQMPPRGPVLLVDDIITSGSQMMGAALALARAFPSIGEMRCFAAMRTISPPDPFEGIRSPATGVVILQRSGSCLRRP